MNKKTKKYFIYLCIILIFVFFSCVQDMVVGTIWAGTFETSTFKGDGQFYFRPNDEIEGFIEVAGTANKGIFINMEGEYQISASETFTADLIGYAEINGDAVNEEFILELDGVLNYTTGISTGEYIIEINFSDGGNYKEKGDFELQQVK